MSEKRHATVLVEVAAPTMAEAEDLCSAIERIIRGHRKVAPYIVGVMTNCEPEP